MNRKEILLQAIDELKKKKPSSVTIYQKKCNDEEFGDCTEITFIPLNPNSASLEIVLDETGCWGWTIDKWSRVECHLGLKKGKREIDFVVGGYGGLDFLEITELQQIYDSVSQGKIEVTVGIILNKLVGTRCEYLPFDERRFVLEIGNLWLAKIAAFVGCGKLQKLDYSPW